MHAQGQGDPAVAALVAVDATMAAIAHRDGVPAPSRRPWTVRTIALVVLEQQLSLDAAAAHLAALEVALCGAASASALAGLDATLARAAGVSRQKHRTLVAVGEAVLDGTLDLAAVAAADDDDARAAITAVHGLGRWTADVLLLGALERTDVWPVGDRALAVAVAEELGLDDVPTAAASTAISERWRPHRSAAARLLWHAYLSRRGRSVPQVL